MDLFHWERFEPRIGLNHELPPEKRFFLQLACGLSKVQLKKVARAQIGRASCRERVSSPV